MGKYTIGLLDALPLAASCALIEALTLVGYPPPVISGNNTASLDFRLSRLIKSRSHDPFFLVD